MDNQFKTVLRTMVSDLVKNELVVKNAGGTYTLIKPIWGFTGDIAFQSEQDAIEKLTASAVNHYSALKIAS